MSEPMWAKCALQATKHFNKPFLSLFLFFTLGNATVFAQQQQVRLSSKILTVQKMMSEIEKQTLLSQAQAEAEKIIRDAEKAAFNEVKKQIARVKTVQSEIK